MWVWQSQALAGTVNVTAVDGCEAAASERRERRMAAAAANGVIASISRLDSMASLPSVIRRRECSGLGSVAAGPLVRALVPVLVQRPARARETGRPVPLVIAARTSPARGECIPHGSTSWKKGFW